MKGPEDSTSKAPRARAVQPLPLPPVNNSLDFPIEQPERPDALHLFLDNFKPNNKLVFAGKFHNRWTTKFRTDFGGSGAELLDEAQVSGPVGGADARLRLKPEAVSLHLDLGHHLLSHKTFLQAGERQSASSFWNPYLVVETDRAFGRAALGLGVMVHSDNYYKDNLRLTLRAGAEGRPAAELATNSHVKRRGLAASLLTRMTVQSGAVHFLERRAVLGLERGGYQLGAEAELAEGSYREWALAAASAALSLDFREQGVFGGLLAWRRGEARPKPSICYRNQFSPNLKLKTRVDFDGRTALYANLRIKDGLNLHCSLQTRGPNGSESNGLFDLPLDLGFKLKLER